MKKFIFYISLFFLIFNISIAKANDNKNDFSILEQTYKVNNLADNINEGQKITPYIKGNNKFVTFLMIPYLADKVFKDSNIKNEDMVLFLKLFYPNTNESKLIAFGNVVKYAIYTKRWYIDIVKKAEHEAMANKIFSQDAPIIAKDGEYICFIEVKYRKNRAYGFPEEAVTAAKQKKIIQGAKVFLYQNRRRI